MQNNRPYWKVFISFLFSIIVTFLVVGVGVSGIRFFMPFVIGYFIAYLANPIVCWLENKLKMKKKWGSALTIVAVLAAVVGGIYLAVVRIIKETKGLVSNLPDMLGELEKDVTRLVQLLPDSFQKTGMSLTTNLEEFAGRFLGQYSESMVTVAGDFAKSIPSVLIGVLMALLSSYFFVAEKEEVLLWAKKVTPKPIQDRMTLVVSNLKTAIGGYFKAQFQIMIVVALILFVAFGLMEVRYAFLLALLIAFLDFLPFFGTGTALCPWALYSFLMKEYKMVTFLLILYGVTQVVHHTMQPKLVGDGVGLKPLPTLVFLYIGYKMGGILWMILAVPIGMIVINMYYAGAFDYLLDDAKILWKGIMSLRE